MSRWVRGGRARAGSLRGDWPLAVGLATGVLVDAVVGDPRRGHPVAAFGRVAAWLESRAYADDQLRGAGYATVCVLAATAPAAVIHVLTRDRPLARATTVAAAAWAVLGARSLRREAARLAAALAGNDLVAARGMLPNLCGRDPDSLDATQLARAVVESVAENTSDAVVGPLLWGAAAGLPGLLGYRAVNTLDAMVGHRSARYARFGWAAARLDDVAGAVAARLTALLVAACAPVVGGHPLATVRAVARYGRGHPSPNAGYPEAAFAGALGVRLGGTNSYGGVVEHRPILGEGRPPGPVDIHAARRLSLAVTLAATVLALIAALGGAR